MGDKIPHYKWLIEKKLGDTFRFEQRQLQLIAISMLAISFLIPDLNYPYDWEIILVGIVGVAIVGLIIIYLWFSLVRSVQDAIDSNNEIIKDSNSKNKIDSTDENTSDPKSKIEIDIMLLKEDDLSAYYDILVTSVKDKAKIMKLSYLFFGVSMTGTIVLTILSVF